MIQQKVISNSKPSEDFEIEDIYRYAFVASQNTTVYLELWDKNGKTIPFNNGSNVGVATLTVTSTASSWPALAATAGYTTNALNGIPIGVNGIAGGGAGAQPFASGGCLKVPNGAASSVNFNLGGSHDGTGTNGISGTSAGPTANSPGILNAGDLVMMGLEWDGSR